MTRNAAFGKQSGSHFRVTGAKLCISGDIGLLICILAALACSIGTDDELWPAEYLIRSAKCSIRKSAETDVGITFARPNRECREMAWSLA